MDAVHWLEGLELFGWKLGLERMEALLERLGRPERAFRAIHVVGTNGKTSVTRDRRGAPPRRGRRDRRLHLAARDRLERADPRPRRGGRRRAGARPRAARRGGGRRDAVRGADGRRVRGVRGRGRRGGRRRGRARRAARRDERPRRARSSSSRTSPSSTRSTWGRRGRRSPRRSSPWSTPGATVVLGEPEWEEAARARGATDVRVAQGNAELARAAVEAFLDRPVAEAEPPAVPGRLEQVADDPLEIWDGAHNPAGVAYLLERLPERDWTLVLSILADKDADAMLGALATARRTARRDLLRGRAGPPGRRARRAGAGALPAGRIRGGSRRRRASGRAPSPGRTGPFS